MFDELLNPPPSVDSLVLVDLAAEPAVSTDTPYSTSIDQDALSAKESTSQAVTPINVHSINQPPEFLDRWTKSYPIANVIRDPSCFVSTRKQLRTDAMWCYFDAFLTFVEPKNFKEAITEPSWIDAMQEEIYEFQ
ncbi:hypothetical protein Tco_0656904 [Tanacetum coccineum]|uniref:Integrase, catalytic region, zinc finger, CCHC-type, peptidase aspartic, catalytic n=1 Tax=Tanacetum coccineum TaxID=301880 RepID=A0ABQ4XAR9_9ASTR